MKKIFTLLMIAMVGFALTGCRQRIWDELDELDNRVTALEEIAQKMNSDIAAIQTILNAIQNNVFVTDVIKTPEGYTIQFSDGTSAVISNGTDGSNAPVISIKQDTDGNYYWTINGEWLIVDGERVRANFCIRLSICLSTSVFSTSWRTREIAYDFLPAGSLSPS